MFSWLANAWRVPELRRRVLFTGLILGLYRLGSWMPAPGVDSKSIQDFFGSGGRGSSIFGLLNLFSGSALSRFSIFALGIMPYVTASIILQLMTVVVPKLAQVLHEGDDGVLPHRLRVHEPPFGQEVGVGTQVPAVGGQGVGRQPPLHGQPAVVLGQQPAQLSLSHPGARSGESPARRAPRPPPG